MAKSITMKRIYTSLLLLSIFLLEESCISNPKYDSESISNARVTSVKVVHSNTEDRMVTLIEQAMMRREWKVIANNRVSTFLPTGAPVSIQVSDTVFSIPQSGLIAQELFQEKQSDCILRYTYQNFWRERVANFNASLIQTATGEVLSTFDFKQKMGIGSKPIKAVLDKMATAFAVHLQ